MRGGDRAGSPQPQERGRGFGPSSAAQGHDQSSGVAAEVVRVLCDARQPLVGKLPQRQPECIVYVRIRGVIGGERSGPGGLGRAEEPQRVHRFETHPWMRIVHRAAETLRGVVQPRGPVGSHPDRPGAHAEVLQPERDVEQVGLRRIQPLGNPQSLEEEGGVSRVFWIEVLHPPPQRRQHGLRTVALEQRPGALAREALR